MKKFYLLHLLNRTVFGIFFSCSVANLLADGLSLKEASLAFFYFTIFTGILEIPFGMFADRFGRKTSVLIGSGFVASGFALLAFGAKFSYVGMSLISIGLTFVSGADKAWYVSELASLPDRNKPSSETLFLNLSLFERGAMVIGAFMGPFLMSKNPSFVWIASALIAFIALFYATTISEHPLARKQHSSETEKPNLKSLLTGASLPFFILIAATFGYGLGEGGKGMVIHPYILALNNNSIVSLTLLQVLLVISRMGGILAYKHYFKKFMKGPQFVVLSIFLMMLSQIAAFTNNFAIFMTFYMIAIFSVGWGDPLMTSTINSTITNEKFKATYFSINNSMSAFGETLAYLALSYSLTSEKLHLGWQFGILGYGLSAAVFAIAVLLNRRIQLKPAIELNTPS